MIKWFKYILIVFGVMMASAYIWSSNKTTITIGKDTYILQNQETKSVSLDEFMQNYNSGNFLQVKIANDKDIIWYQRLANTSGQTNTWISKPNTLTDINNLYQKYSLTLPDSSKVSIINVTKYISHKPSSSSINDLGIYPVKPNTQLIISNDEDSFINMFVQNVLPLVFMLWFAILIFKFFWPKWWLGGLPFSFKIWKDNKDTNNTTTFADVAGMEEVKWDLVEIVVFLNNPD